MAHTTLRNHRKLLGLMRTLKIDRPQAVGHLQCLWWSAYEGQVNETGALEGWTVVEIADAAEWPDDPGPFVEALCGARFLDALPVLVGQPNCDQDCKKSPTRYAIHDFADWAPHYVKMRWRRQKPGSVITTEHNGAQRSTTEHDVLLCSPTEPNRTEPNRTEPNTTEQNITTGPDRSSGISARKPDAAGPEVGLRADGRIAGSGRGNGRANQAWCQVLVLKIAEALGLDPVRAQRNRASLYAVARRAWMCPDRDAAAEKLVAAAESKCVPGLDNPAAAFQKEIDRWLPKDWAKQGG